MAMDNEYYQQLWTMLDQLYTVRFPGDNLRFKDPTTLVTFAERVQKQLGEFIEEAVARAKAKDTDIEAMLKYRRDQLKPKGYEKATPHSAPLCPE